MQTITSFVGNYRFLSNFHEYTLHFPNPFVNLIESFKSVEHAYQSFKATNAEDFQLVKLQSTPGRAKTLGRKIDKRDNFEKIKVYLMAHLVRSKFEQSPNLMNRLLDTGVAILEERNHWGDQFWGITSDRKGKNNLGRILMRVRENEKHRRLLWEYSDYEISV